MFSRFFGKLRILTLCTTIVDLVKSVVSFLSCGVPNDKLDILTSCYRHILLEACSIYTYWLILIENVPHESQGERCLANTGYILRLFCSNSI